MSSKYVIDLLFNYLANSSISDLHSHFIDTKSYVILFQVLLNKYSETNCCLTEKCNKLSYKIVEYSLCYINFSFINVQLSSLDKIKAEFFSIMQEIVSKKTTLDMNRLTNIIKMKISEIQDKVCF
jgi:hypothetical protein